MVESISVSELRRLNITNIIDIRSVEKFNNNHIPGAKHIIYEQLLLYPGKYLNPNIKYYIYCQKGIQSRNLCQILKSKGYNVVNIIGGYEAWILSE